MESRHFVLHDPIRPITAEKDPLRLESDITSLCSKATALGAGGVAAAGPQDLVFSDEIISKVKADANYPSIHWPIDYPADDLKKAILAFRKGIFLYIDAPSDMPDYGGGPIPDRNHLNMHLKLHEMVAHIESAAFYMGHYLAMGFAAGNCRSIFCAEEGRCNAAVRTNGCTAPYKGRPSLTAAGIDVIKTAQKLRLQLPGADSSFLAGLVMVA